MVILALRFLAFRWNISALSFLHFWPTGFDPTDQTQLVNYLKFKIYFDVARFVVYLLFLKANKNFPSSQIRQIIKVKVGMPDLQHLNSYVGEIA